MGFASDLMPLINKGEKTLTYRLGSQYATLLPGEHVTAYDSSGLPYEIQVRIRNVSQVPFGELPVTTEGHEPYRSREHMHEVFSGYYGRAVDPWEAAVVIEFMVI